MYREVIFLVILCSVKFILIAAYSNGDVEGTEARSASPIYTNMNKRGNSDPILNSMRNGFHLVKNMMEEYFERLNRSHLFLETNEMSQEGARGKKRKKKKALMKLILVASLLKGKIEILLKLLSAHLQIKFFLIALVGLLINIARFWIDLKRGQQPPKVIYYEQAHHQHHYDDSGDDWAGGGYWKRSLDTSENISERLDNVSLLNINNDEASQFMAFKKQL